MYIGINNERHSKPHKLESHFDRPSIGVGWFITVILLVKSITGVFEPNERVLLIKIDLFTVPNTTSK